MSNTTTAAVTAVRLAVVAMLALALMMFVCESLHVEGRPENADEVTEVEEVRMFVLPVVVPELLSA